MAVEIRSARPEDADEVVAMGQAMHDEAPEYAARDFDPEKVRRLMLSLCGTLLVPLTGCVLIAEDGGKIIGMMGGFAVEHFFGHDKIASDYVLYVKPEHRRGTAAVRLIRTFEKWAVEQGAAAIHPGVTTGVANERVRDLYARLGYEPNGYTLVKRIK